MKMLSEALHASQHVITDVLGRYVQNADTAELYKHNVNTTAI